jgi:hypothetical protein
MARITLVSTKESAKRARPASPACEPIVPTRLIVMPSWVIARGTVTFASDTSKLG